MINTVTLKNFRRHRDLSVSFGAGMTAIRALNEQGKSTLLEAIAYALFGVKAIRDGLDDVVTWGEHVNTLKVELQMSVDGVIYDIKRSKGGAEVNYDGGIVTGQNEVSNFVAKLMKVDATAAARLTMSNQGEIRGALEAGTKATTELIERLAEFDQIDKLIELMQDKLTLGSPVTVEANITAAKATIERLEREVVAVDEALPSKIQSLGEQISHQAVAVGEAQAKVERVQEILAAVREAIVERTNAARNHEKAAEALASLEKRAAAPLPTLPADFDAQVSELERQISDADNAVDYRPARAAFEAANYKGLIIREDYSVPDLKLTIEGLKASIAKANTELVRLHGEEKLLEQKLLQGTCSFCGKDFSGVPEVAQRNAETTAQLESVRSRRAMLADNAKDFASSLSGHEELLKASLPALAAVEKFPGTLTLLDAKLPPVLVWNGPANLNEPPNAGSLRRRLRELQGQRDEFNAAKTRRDALLEQIVEAKAAVADAAATLAALPERTADAAQSALQDAREAHRAATAQLQTLQTQLQACQSSLREQEAAKARAEAGLADARERLATFEKQLKELEFNNNLLKRVKQARPVLADKLWSIVLAAVSGYFSEIRGVQSVVTKERDGFKVDEHSVSSLSGSTLDALGLAIRVALVRTFLPSSPFLILDEPAAAMDGERTQNMLGFLSSCGFGQVIYVTHEEVSDAVADHLLSI